MMILKVPFEVLGCTVNNISIYTDSQLLYLKQLMKSKTLTAL